uniref:interferon omega-1-like n=1 Tax=Panthera onca TaxID=9690 RepID=UPI002953B59E|nr:interferon omega-1-like [Panthera onca]
MALLRPLLTALALLTCRPGGSLGCALPGSHAQVSRDNLVLLGQMRRLAPLHGLRSGLHRQLEALDACLVQATGEGERAPGMHGPALAIKRYFQDIRVYLEDQGYSDCAWEIVRLEIMRALSSSATLQDSLAIKDGDLGSP